MKFAGACLIAESTYALAVFYQALFGEEGQWEGSDHVDFPGKGIAIFSVKGMEEMAPRSTEGTGCGRAVLSFDVEEVDELTSRLKELGATVLKPPQDHPWGLRSVWIKDTEGNILSIRCPVK